ncbi:MAG: class I SAM-dependent methyltransferase [Chlorobiales bacterium]
MTSSSYTAMSFREIAEKYNRINFIPLEAQKAIGESICARVGKGALLLDVGAGAGRISIPIAMSGVQTIAFDIESQMLNELSRQANALNLNIQTVQGDATQLPFADASFDAVFTSNLLHLVADWKTALAQMKRVLKNGGVLIQGRDWLAPNSAYAKIRNQLRAIIGELNPKMMPTAAAGGALFQALAEMGGITDKELIAAEWTETLSPNQLFDKMKAREQNETWQLENTLFHEALARLEKWIEINVQSPDKEETVVWRFLLYATRFV